MNSTDGCTERRMPFERPGRPARTGVQGRAGCTEGQDELGDKGVEGGAWQTGSACEKRAKTLGKGSPEAAS